MGVGNAGPLQWPLQLVPSILCRHYRLPDPVFAEAAGVLEMIAKNPDGHRLYNQRL